MVLEAFPSIRGKGHRSCDTLGGKIRKGRVVRLAIVHQDFALAANAKVLVSPLGGVGHGYEGDVAISESVQGFPE